MRVAIGLTLLSDPVKLDVLYGLDDTPQVQEQLEVLEFAEVPLEILDDQVKLIDKLAQDIVNADTVYII